MTVLNRIFNPENGFFRVMGLLVDVVAFSLMWLVCAATVVLLGPGTTALYDAMARHLRRGVLGGYVRFWESLKANFKVGCAAGLVVFALGWALLELHGVLFAGAAADNHTMFALYVAFWVCQWWCAASCRIFSRCCPGSPSAWEGCCPPA